MNRVNTWLEKIVLNGLVLVITLPVAIFCIAVLVIAYTGAQFPYPAPYQQTSPQKTLYMVSAGRYAESFTYIVDAPLNEVKQYYIEQMPRYCTSPWTFNLTHAGCQDYLECQEATCEMGRFLVPDAQSFSITLYAKTTTQTEVNYSIIGYEF